MKEIGQKSVSWQTYSKWILATNRGFVARIPYASLRQAICDDSAVLQDRKRTYIYINLLMCSWREDRAWHTMVNNWYRFHEASNKTTNDCKLKSVMTPFGHLAHPRRSIYIELHLVPWNFIHETYTNSWTSKIWDQNGRLANACACSSWIIEKQHRDLVLSA